MPRQPGRSDRSIGRDVALSDQYGKTYTGWTLHKMVEENPRAGKLA
jgi:hypothetical protein